MVLRNMSPLLRRWHMHMFAWTGKITLETYILQFHIWMKTTGVNGSPKHLMVRRRCPPPPPTRPAPTARRRTRRAHASHRLRPRSRPRQVWLPGWYWTNFLLTTVVYIFVSYRIFKITATLRDACIPRDNAKIVGRLAGACVVLGALFAVGAALRGGSVA